MKTSKLKAFVKQIIREVNDLDRELQIQGYGTMKESKIQNRIKEDLIKAQQAFDKKDWNTLNYILGRTGNGVIPQMITTLKDNIPKHTPVISQSRLPNQK